jgi:hypothetical protein
MTSSPRLTAAPAMGLPLTGDRLRDFSEVHIDQNLEQSVAGKEFSNALLFNCSFKNLRGLVLKNCDLNQSEFKTESIREAMGFTMTLDCNSFNDVRFSPLLVKLLLTLLYTTKGNDEMREKLPDVIGRKDLDMLLRTLKRA